MLKGRDHTCDLYQNVIKINKLSFLQIQILTSSDQYHQFYSQYCDHHLRLELNEYFYFCSDFNN